MSDNKLDIEEKTPLVDRKALLQKFSDKGGWTYAELPEILPDDDNPLGWLVDTLLGPFGVRHKES
ncbi:hypothetical protein [Fodinibius halophilus]|uniref:Uncharacterized protein n=1 Tax=Fodinibius halophilus TaxID=1736908 RepID=A0A6M1T8M4_9BACT|nr:hypothetical protein [Fodinibius halophilus]NGP88391.1 hypothetical protein [Fodinibius halophilus]